MMLLNGKMEEELRKLPDNSVDSVVTDPPYGISFMSKKWDYDVPSAAMWEEVYRVLKPGGHLISFSSARTYHRMAVEVEDAGFEIRDQIMWVYGSGFPKSHNIGKGVDKKLGNERTVVGDNPNHRTSEALFELGFQGGKGDGKVTKGSSEWEGWGTALKPAHEPMVLARKPFKGTVVDNTLKWGVGGINVDASRVPTEETITTHSNGKGCTGDGGIYGHFANQQGGQSAGQELGRFPANFIHDGSDEVVEHFPDKAGAQAPVKGDEPSHTKQNAIYGDYSMVEGKPMAVRDNLGSAARFFYVPKVSKKDRNEGGVDNKHPTVKPTDLMHYVIRMVTPAGGVVLDPFMGSGSTGKAAVRNGYEFIGIEMEQSSFDVAKARIEWEMRNEETEETSKSNSDAAS